MNSMGSDFKRTGGCQCGAVRYTIHAPANETYHCHCEMCRKLHGALFGTFSGVPRDRITIDKGADNLTTYDSSPPNHRKFCKTCGCYVFGDDERFPDMYWFTPATLDGGADPGHPKETEKHIFVRWKVPWYEIGDDLPKYDEFAPD